MVARPKVEHEVPAIEELNLVEFPLAVLADRVEDGRKTLVFEDEIGDDSTGQKVHRRVTVTGSDAWGLPTWQDMDVLLSLMALTEQSSLGFRREVEFTLGQLRRLLRWPKNGSYNKRLKLALKRLLGVTLVYENAWRKKDRWVSLDGFHLLDNVTLSRTKEEFDEDERQVFKWNDVVVESCRNRYTKGLDWDFYVSLKKPSTKRLYRFLDKRFGLRAKWPPFDLRSFCVNKLGMASGWRASDYKKKLLPAIEELEDRGFLARKPAAERFFAPKRGEYRVCFERAKKSKKASVEKTVVGKSPLEQALLSRGVSNASQLVAEYPAERIERAIENFDDRNRADEGKTAGWLVTAIKSENEFGFRKGYKSKAELAAVEKRIAKRAKHRADREAREEQQRLAAEHAALESVREYIKSNGLCHDVFLKEALASSSLLRRQYEQARDKEDQASMKIYADTAIVNYWRKLVKQKSA